MRLRRWTGAVSWAGRGVVRRFLVVRFRPGGVRARLSHLALGADASGSAIPGRRVALSCVRGGEGLAWAGAGCPAAGLGPRGLANATFEAYEDGGEVEAMKMYAVRETFTGMYAVDTSGSWVKDHVRATHFSERPRAEAFLKRLKAGPRQFAGLNQKTEIVEVEMGSQPGGTDR